MAERIGNRAGPMRILVTIPHFYRATTLGYYGSLGQDHRPRLDSLIACLTSLHQTFGGGQGLLHGPGRCLRPTNEADGDGTAGHSLDIVVCTTGNLHLADHLPAGLCRHHATDAPPQLLGYECHRLLRDGLGRYDWYVYLEDDLCVTDAFFFDKLSWFQALAADERCVLQPNRFELADQPPVFRLYIDGRPASGAPPLTQMTVATPCILTAPFLNRSLRFQRTPNPHAGCFFLTDAQMGRWAGMPDFLDLATDYIGPLESAATLGLIRHFAVYKPARETAAFLEVRHGDPRYLNRRLSFADAPPHPFQILRDKN